MPVARSRLTVDLNALAANYHLFRKMAGSAEVAPVVKADGYGLGAGPIARRLWAEGARSFFVARLDEGEALREALGANRPARIYVLDGAPNGSGPRLHAADLTPILNSPAQVEVFSAFARARGALPCGLHIDTGMNRLGLRLEEIEALTGASDRLTGLKVELAISHLACADQEEHRMNAQQAGRFSRARALLPGVRASLANTSGLFLGQDYLFDMVRPGVGLFGGGPFGQAVREITPVATFEAPILEVRAVSAGETVGYGAAFEAGRSHRVAIVAAGYADGMLRSTAGAGQVWFDGALRPLLGRVSMDLVAVDVTGSEAASPGAYVEFVGPGRLLDDVAAAAGTVSYEVLTRLGARAERVYVGAVD
jgi:alanine racemase